MTRTDIDQLLDEAHQLGFEVRRNGDRLHVEGPREAEWFIAKLAEAKPQILDALAAEKTDHVREVGFLPVPYPDEPDTDDPTEGRRIIAAIESVGGWTAIERGRIVLRWRGDPPCIPELIDRIRANRIGIVSALTAGRGTPRSV